MRYSLPIQDLVQVDEEKFNLVKDRCEADVVRTPEDGVQRQNYFSYGTVMASKVSTEEGDTFYVRQAVNKKTVYFDVLQPALITVGQRAEVYPFNHTSPLVSNSHVCYTSTVLSHNKETGAFETLNTHYVPATLDEFIKHHNSQKESRNG